MGAGPDVAETATANMPAGWMAGPGIAHGGMLAAAARRFPDAPQPFVDLSTGINPHPYPMPDLTPECFTRLPDAEDLARLEAVAARIYGAASSEMVVAAPGTQILISLLPHLLPCRDAPKTASVAILSPTYGEHARSWVNAGYPVTEIDSLEAAGTADRVILCNPNNPNGRRFAASELRPLADRLAKRGGWLVIDEAFADFDSPGTSFVPHLPHPAIVVLRSFGKTYGLAGIRLGFMVADATTASLLRLALGPWVVSGPAIEVGVTAFGDDGWRRASMARLVADAARLDALVSATGLRLIGGTLLFRLYEGDRAPSLLDQLGQGGILVRGFAGHARWLRFGIPGSPSHWARLERLIAAIRQ